MAQFSLPRASRKTEATARGRSARRSSWREVEIVVRNRKARLWPIAGVVTALLGAYWTTAFFLERTLLFPTPIVVPRVQPEDGLEAIPLPAVKGLLLGPTSGFTGPAPLMIFMHGNAETAAGWVEDFTVPRSWGWAALLLEYPGYGREPGRPSEESIGEVAAVAYDWARHDTRIDASRIIVYGRSLGGAPAAHLAATRPVAGLILESSFSSVARLAARFLIPPFAIRDRFDTLGDLRTYRGPLLVLHGSGDEIVPIDHGRRLAAAVPGAAFVLMPCGHNDCVRPWAAVETFLAAKGLMRPVESGTAAPGGQALHRAPLTATRSEPE